MRFTKLKIDKAMQADAFVNFGELRETQPRNYAFDYLAAKGVEANEREALKGCPKEWQELVKTHIKIAKGRRK